MNIETISVLVLLAVCCLVLTLLDLTVSGVLALAFGLQFKKAFCIGLWSLMLPVVLTLYGMLIERNCVQVKRVELTFDNLPESFDGYRIVQLSDIHSRSFAKRPRVLRKAVDKVNALDADLIAFTGDIISMDCDELGMTENILKDITAREGVMAVLGNHDYGIYGKTKTDCSRDVARRVGKMGWDMLLDEHRILSRNGDSIAIIGVENTTPSHHFQSRGNLTRASEGTDGMFRILLSHDPMHWDMEVVGHDWPLMLSGHTHAIQFSLFGWCPSRYLFKQYRGLYRNGSQCLYVNIGLGETIIPIRVGTPPEVTLIELHRAKK